MIGIFGEFSVWNFVVQLCKSFMYEKQGSVSKISKAYFSLHVSAVVQADGHVHHAFCKLALCDFFGEVAAFPKGPVALALKSEVPIVPATFLKVNGKYTLIFNKPFYVPLFENEAQSIQQGVKVLAKSFEELISLDINQWHSIQWVLNDALDQLVGVDNLNEVDTRATASVGILFQFLLQCLQSTEMN